jgi:hypothetical protein
MILFTRLILFTKRRNLEGFVAQISFNTELKLNMRVKYLAVTIDTIWKIHIDSKIQKASIAYWQCRRAGSVLDIHFGKRPMLTYAALIRCKRTYLHHCEKLVSPYPAH